MFSLILQGQKKKRSRDVKISVSFILCFHTGLVMTDKIVAFYVSFFVPVGRV